MRLGRFDWHGDARAVIGAYVIAQRVRICEQQLCSELADGNRNVDLYHWSSAKFSSAWYDTLSVLVAKGRAQVGVAASSGDWSKRIRDAQYTDHEDYTVGS